MPKISAIAAMSENRVIGRGNKLPWHLPADLKRFKALTTGHPIIMGRKTYESIGKLLTNRLNIIVTHNKHFQAPGCLVATSLEEAIALAKQNEKEEIFIIGGAILYQQALPLLDSIYLTVIKQHVEGDTFFPALDEKYWRTIEQIDHTPDNENSYAYCFLHLTAKHGTEKR